MELYNEKIKSEYLDQFSNHSTRLIAMYPLRKASSEEKRLGKDIYEMNVTELGDIIRGFSSSTENAVLTNIHQMEEYIKWTASRGYRRSNLSPFPVSDRAEWARQFVTTYRRYSFTKKEVLDMTEELVNCVDRAVMLLLFEGARGTRFSEILNLKLDDIKEDNGKYALKLTDQDGEVRTIAITDILAKTLKRADKQREYSNKNGLVDNPRYQTSEFADSEFIFKRARRGRQRGAMDNFFVNRKIALFKEVFGHEFLKAQHVSNSGIMHMANELHEKEGGFTAEHARTVAEQYDTAFTTTGGHRYRNVTIIRKIVESKEFEDLYGYKLNIKF